jgi:hypothetical protein
MTIQSCLRLGPQRTSDPVRPYGLLIGRSLLEAFPRSRGLQRAPPTPQTTMLLPPAPGGGPPAGLKAAKPRGGGGEEVRRRRRVERLQPPERAATRQRAHVEPHFFTCLAPFSEYTQHSSSAAWQAAQRLPPSNFSPNSVSMILPM